MILTCHLLAGAAIASKAHNPVWALFLSFLSHYFLDLLPHDEYSINNIHAKLWSKTGRDFIKVLLDILCGIMLISLFSKNSPLIFACAFLAIIPDSITLFSKFFLKNKLIILHQKIHMALNSLGDRDINKKIPLFWAVFGQTVFILAMIFLL